VEIRFTKRFLKQLSKLTPAQEARFYNRLRLWQIDPVSPQLRHHALAGKLKGFYSINVTGDIRALYRVHEDTIYVYELIGTHSQLYG